MVSQVQREIARLGMVGGDGRGKRSRLLWATEVVVTKMKDEEVDKGEECTEEKIENQRVKKVHFRKEATMRVHGQALWNLMGLCHVMALVY